MGEPTNEKVSIVPELPTVLLAFLYSVLLLMTAEAQ